MKKLKGPILLLLVLIIELWAAFNGYLGDIERPEIIVLVASMAGIATLDAIYIMEKLSGKDE